MCRGMCCLGGLAMRVRDRPQRFVPTAGRSFVEAHLLPDLHEAVVGRLVQVGLAAVLVLELQAPVLERRSRAGDGRPGTCRLGRGRGHRPWWLDVAAVGAGAGGTSRPAATGSGASSVTFAALLVELVPPVRRE